MRGLLRDALLLAAGELMREVVDAVGEADALEHLSRVGAEDPRAGQR